MRTTAKHRATDNSAAIQIEAVRESHEDVALPPARPSGPRTASIRLWLLFLSVFSLAGVAVQAQTFQTIKPLVFTKAYQGANPLPQVVTVASTGSTFSFYASVVSGTGGNWLSINLNSSYYNTSRAVTVTANPDVTLAAGTYTAQISLRSYDGTFTQTVPVSLVIKPTSATFFDVLPGALTFSMRTKDTVLPSQSVPIRGAGSGTLNFTASATTFNSGGWITLSATSGTAPNLLNVGISVSKLPGQGLTPGTFTGQVLLQTSGDSVTIPVTVTVGDSVFRQMNPLSFSKVYEGADPLPQVFTVASTGDSFSFYASAVSGTGGNWLSINLNTSYYDTSRAVTVSVNPDITLAAGTYTAEIIVRSYDGTQPSVIPITFTVEAASSSSFDELPGQLSFSMVTKGTAPPPQAVPIRNAGNGTLNFITSSSTSDGSGWITLSVTSGAAPKMLQVGIAPSKLPGQGLTPGTFTGQVVLQSAGGTVTIPVTLTVGDSVFRQINPLSFSKAYEGANPLPQVFTVASTGDAFSFYASAVNGTGGNWLSIDLNSSYYNTSRAVTVTVNPDITLAVGTYTAEIIVRSYDGTQSSVVPVTLTVGATTTPFFDALPGELTFSMVTKGMAPPPELIAIRNAGSGTLNFNASSSTADGSGWIILSATSGTAPYLLNVSINPSKLPGQGLTPGTFTGQVVLQSSGNTVSLPVTVSVGDSVFRQINPLNFSKIYQGVNPLPQVITVASTGSAFSFYGSAVNGTGGNWLSINLNSSYYNTSRAITVSVNPDVTLAAGTYTAEIIVRSYDGTRSSVIPVTLTVQASTVTSFDESPGAITFSGKATGAALASQALPIRNAGPGTLNWVGTTSTADTGGWLSLSAASGTAPSTPTVSVNITKLPGKGLTAGTFIGQVLLQSASGLVTVPVTVTLGASVLVQTQSLSFTKAYQGVNPSTQTFTVASSGDQLSFYGLAVNGTGGNWLSINLNTSYYNTPTTVTVTANPNVNLAAGVYTAEIIVRSYDGSQPMVVPVTLTITSSTPTATPKFTPPGGSYSTTQNVSTASSTIDSAIYFTTDGSTPTTSSTRYTSPIQVSATETIKAIAIAPGFPQSAVATAVYTITSPRAATPGATITISEATSGVTVYYTTNGSTPTSSSTKYTGPITLSASEVLKFIAIGPGYSSSQVRTVSTTIQ